MTAVLNSTTIWLPQTQTWLFNQVRYLPEHIEAHIVCERTENLDQFGVPNLHCLGDQPRSRRTLDRSLRWLRVRRHLGHVADTARAVRAGILHSHFGHTGWADMGAARAAGLRHVVTFYGLDVNFLPRHRPIWRRRYPELFARADVILCEGPHMADCIAALGCPPSRIRVQPLGIATDEISFAPCAWREGEPLRVLIAAAFREKKGIPLALDALSKLRTRIPIEITVIGDAGTEPRAQGEKRKIMELIRRRGLEDCIRMLGFQPHSHMLEEARRHHLFLSPSLTAQDGDTEGGAPVSLIEMAASGMLLVSSTHCDIPQVVIDGETGFLAPEGDLDGLVGTLERAVARCDAWAAMRRASRRHVENRFDARRQALRQAELYRELAA